MAGGSVCILGAGVVGMTTAVLLQQHAPNLKLTVCADRFTVDTVSDVAAGIFRPPVNICGNDTQSSRQFIRDSYYYYNKLLQETPDPAGVGMKETYIVSLSAHQEHKVQNHMLRELCPEYRSLTATELSSYTGGHWKYGVRCKSFLVECRLYLPYLMNRFEDAGGTIIHRKINKLEELAGEFDAVINCCGLGARELCGDQSVLPVRGQLIRVKAPWVREAMYVDTDTYILPGIDTVTLGGCRNFDSYNMSVDRHDSNSIMERCQQIMPSLKDAKVIGERVGLRPFRPTIRVEAETLYSEEGEELKVVHNYGHGGYGVCLAPGTSMVAVKMLLQELQGPRL